MSPYQRKTIDNIIESRIRILALFILMLSAVILVRLFSLQVLQHEFYSLMATKRNEVYKDLIPVRGSIYTEENGQLFPLVTNKEYYLIYAEPSKIESAEEVIEKISPILELSDEEKLPLLDRLSRHGDPYEPIKQKVTKEAVDKIKQLDIKGIGFVPETFRYYPEKNIGGQIFGFVGIAGDKKIGQYGLEGYFNEELSGKSGLIKSVRDALGALITVGPRTIQKAENGSSIVLTIDRNIQYTACKSLKEYYERFSAAGANIIVMEPQGAVVAMCNFPDFDPDNYGDVEEIQSFNNPAIFDAYEPGSVFKVITMSAGVDAGLVGPETTYIDTGEVKVDKFTIRNAAEKVYGVQTMTQVLENSVNTGVIFVEQKLGREKFKEYVEKFGFGKKTEITLNSEVAGDISSLDKRSEVYGMTASFGQGLTVTPLQMVVSYAAIANGGILPRPYIVKDIIDAKGNHAVTQPQEVGRAISEKSAALITGMMTSVVEKGYDKKAQVPGYYMAGKTGTAQVAGSNGEYGEDTIHTFAGFGPATNPKFVILIKLDRPKGIRFASDSLSPLFKQIADYLVKYYQIPPDY